MLGRLAGVPMMPLEATPVIVVSERFVPDKSVPYKLAKVRSAPDSSEKSQ
jgi:hypothetical protein